MFKKVDAANVKLIGYEMLVWFPAAADRLSKYFLIFVYIHIHIYVHLYLHMLFSVHNGGSACRIIFRQLTLPMPNPIHSLVGNAMAMHQAVADVPIHVGMAFSYIEHLPSASIINLKFLTYERNEDGVSRITGVKEKW